MCHNIARDRAQAQVLQEIVSLPKKNTKYIHHACRAGTTTLLMNYILHEIKEKILSAKPYLILFMMQGRGHKDLIVCGLLSSGLLRVHLDLRYCTELGSVRNLLVSVSVIREKYQPSKMIILRPNTTIIDDINLPWVYSFVMKFVIPFLKTTSSKLVATVYNPEVGRNGDQQVGLWASND